MNNQISFMFNQDGRTNFMQISAESNLDDVCQAFEDFLRGSGFHFEGRVEVVDDVRVHGDNAPIHIETISHQEHLSCEGCKFITLMSNEEPCCDCANGQDGRYANHWESKDDPCYTCELKPKAGLCEHCP